MDEILYELRDHAAGLNAGRWDYIFSIIKKFRDRPELRAAGPRPGDDGRAVHARLHPAARPDLPSPRRPRDRRHVGVHPEPPRAGGHRQRAGPGPRGQGARGRRRVRRDLGGPSRPRAGRGRGLRPASSATGRTRRSGCARTSRSTPADLLDVAIPGGRVTEAGVRQNVSVGLRYLDAWLRGNGAAAIDNLMEDAATAEISRSQLWQWRRHAIPLEDGRARRRRPLSRDPGRGARTPWRPRSGPPRRGRGPPRPARPGRRLRRVPDPRRLRAARRDGGRSSPEQRGLLGPADEPRRRLAQRLELALDEPAEAPPTDERPVADDERAADDRRADRARSRRTPRTACSRSCGGGRPPGASAGRPDRTGRGRRRLPTSIAPLSRSPNSRAGVVASRSTIRSSADPARSHALGVDEARSVSMPGPPFEMRSNDARQVCFSTARRSGTWSVATRARSPSARSGPQRRRLAGLTERRRDDVAGGFLGRRVVALVGETEVVRAGLGEHGPALGPSGADRAPAPRRRTGGRRRAARRRPGRGRSPGPSPRPRRTAGATRRGSAGRSRRPPGGAP